MDVFTLPVNDVTEAAVLLRLKLAGVGMPVTAAVTV